MIKGHITQLVTKKVSIKGDFPLTNRYQICYNYYIMMSHVMLTLKRTKNLLIMENIICVYAYAVELADLSVLSFMPSAEKNFVKWGIKLHFPLTLTSGICYN